jgi:DNA polymerase-3 subunit delta
MTVPIPLIQLLHGERLLVRRALQECIVHLGISKESEGFNEWYAENTTPNLFLESLGIKSLFHQGTRVFIVHNILKNKLFIEAVDELEKALQGLDADTFVIFVEKNEPDKRTKLYKSIAKLGTIHSFEKLQGVALSRWIQQTATQKGVTFDSGGLETFQLISGSDLLRIEQELEKLSLYAMNKPISVKDVEILASNAMELTVFVCLDALCSKNTQKALTTLHQLDFRDKQDCIEFLGLVAWQFRLLLQATSLQLHYGNSWQRHLAERPFVIEKLKGYVSSFSERKLLSIFDNIVLLDKQFKSTSLDPVLLLERLFIDIAT